MVLLTALLAVTEARLDASLMLLDALLATALNATRAISTFIFIAATITLPGPFGDGLHWTEGDQGQHNRK